MIKTGRNSRELPGNERDIYLLPNRSNCESDRLWLLQYRFCLPYDSDTSHNLKSPVIKYTKALSFLTAETVQESLKRSTGPTIVKGKGAL